MKGLFITNRYYTDNGMKYIYARLQAEFACFSVRLDISKCPIVCQNSTVNVGDYDFIIFWDKDVTACRALENSGYRVFNNSHALFVCDNKITTYSYLAGFDCLIPSLFSPKRYDVNKEDDTEFLNNVKSLGFPLIAKEATGSQGRQVYIINNEEELLTVENSLLNKEHLYQKYVGDEKGSDVRFYLAGGKVVGVCKRTNTTSFASNVCLGGSVSLYEPDSRLIQTAISVSKALKMDFGSVDFIMENGNGLFVEANSNAYFTGIEKLGVNVAKAYAECVLEEVRANA